MIFKDVNSLNNNSEKKFFKEQIDVFIRLIEVCCEKKNIENKEDEILSDEDYNELIDIGVIQNTSEIKDLKKFLKSSFSPFIKSVKFARKNKNITYEAIWKLYNSERKKFQDIEDNKKDLTLIDFFCGAGGLSLGFIQEGFNIKLANDIEEVCIQTFKYNHPQLPSSKIIFEDIREIPDILDYIDCDIDVIVGGPPCQGFSQANQQRIIDDPRNELYKYFLIMVEKIMPKFVVMENVKGMLKVADQVVEDYKNIKIKNNEKSFFYDVDYQILNSSDFSVAQKRERLIYIAIRSDVEEKLNISPKDIFDIIEDNNKENKIYFLNDVLKDIKPLDAPRVKNMTNVDSDIFGKKIDVNYYENNSNEYLKIINKNRKIPFIFNHKARYCNDINYEIYEKLDQGDDSTNEKVKDIMPYSHRNHVFKDKYYKLIADKPCRTITAHMRMDCHSHIHPYQVRSLTPREAARVQSFPDDYLFWGPYLKTYMQIGNAVPPVMARGIAKVIKSYLEEFYENYSNN